MKHNVLIKLEEYFMGINEIFGIMDEDFQEQFQISADSWLTFGNELRNKKEYVKAIKAYNEGLKNYPNYPPLLFNLSCLYQESGKLDAALESLNQYLQESEDKFALYKKSIILKKLNRDAESTEAFFEAERIEGLPSEKYCVDERKNAVTLLNLKTENMPKERLIKATKNKFDIKSVSNEQLTKEITTYIRNNYPNYETLSISFLIQNYFQTLSVNLNLLPLESKNKIYQVQFEVECQLLWDLVPHRIKTISSEELALELVEFIKKELLGSVENLF